MEGGCVGGGGGGGGRGEVVTLHDAVQQLVARLVVPVLPGGALGRDEAPAPEAQEIVARQVHAVVLLYNYYHRKQFPQLEFADPKSFCTSASVAAGASLLPYLNRGHGAGSGDDAVVGEFSVTDRAVADACGIAEALDATLDSPEMAMWPISKVAVLLLDGTKKRCLIEHGAITKGVWSIIKKELNGDSGSTDLPVRRSKRKAAQQDSEPYMLQQIAYSEVERKTGMKRSNLRALEEHLVYSLSKKGTSTMLFVLQYEQTMNDRFREMSLKNLIHRISGPIIKNNPCPATTYAVDYYHILPYEKVLLDLLNREWPHQYSSSAQKEQSCRKGKSLSHYQTQGSLKAPKVNRKSKMAKTTTTISASNKHKPVVKAVGNSGTNNCSTMRQTRNQIEKITEKSGGITVSTNDQMYALLQSLQKMRDNALREQCMLGDQSAELDMDIQTILSEGGPTPRVMSIINKHANITSSDMLAVANPMCSGEGCQTRNIKRMRLKEAIIPQRNKCQELDDICRENNWMLPRYKVLPLVTDEKYQASVFVLGPDFDFSAESDTKTTPHETRESAASNMIHRLLQQISNEN